MNFMMSPSEPNQRFSLIFNLAVDQPSSEASPLSNATGPHKHTHKFSAGPAARGHGERLAARSRTRKPRQRQNGFKVEATARDYPGDRDAKRD
jgi:hypothetical protein